MTAVNKLEVASNTSATDNPLTPAEALELSRCEQIIRKGLDTFIEVGHALFVIRDQRLYRNTHDTFEAYCRDKWKFTARQANRLIGAGGVVENLKRDQLVSSVPAAIPENEAQARPLTELPPAKQAQAAKIVAAKTDAPTAKDYQKAVEEVTGKKSHSAGNVKNANTKTGRSSMESLIEIIDEVETMVRGDQPKDAIMKKLKAAADLATRINNGGVSC